jgi:hypothetical protein
MAPDGRTERPILGPLVLVDCRRWSEANPGISHFASRPFQIN